MRPSRRDSNAPLGDTRVFVFGRNTEGQLGVAGDTVPLPTACTALEGRVVHCLGAGKRHSVALGANGDCYTFGADDCGQLGLGEATGGAAQPRLVKPLTVHRAVEGARVTHAWSGDATTMVLMDNGTLWCWGDNSDGLLLLERKRGVSDNVHVSVPRIVLCKLKIRTLSLGAAHGLALSVGGAVWAWGSGANGRLGLGDAKGQSTMQRVELLSDVVSVSCGWAHSAALEANGRLWMFGLNQDGQLGLGHTEDAHKPEPVTGALAGRMVRTVRTGYCHTAAVVGQRGELYTWGLGLSGQLGHGEFASVWTPRRVEALVVAEVACGGFHTLATTPAKHLHAWGDGSYGQLGLQAESLLEPIALPRRVLLDGPAISVAAGCWHSLVLVSYKTRDQAIDNDHAFRTDGSGVTTQSSSVVEHSGSEDEDARGSGRVRRVGSLLALLFGGDSVDDTVPKSTIDAMSRVRQVEKLEATWRAEVLPSLDALRSKGTLLDMLEDRGPPATVRGQLWRTLVGNGVGVTHHTWEEVRGLLRFSLADERRVQTSRELVRADLPRTFPQLGVHVSLGAELAELLDSFAVFRCDLGYVQGMSFMGAMLLLHMESFEAFVVLCNVMQTHFFESLFHFNVRECTKHLRVFDLLFSKQLPDLFAHFNRLGVSPEHYLLDWFLSLFSRTLPFACALRVFDGFFLQGEVFLFRTAVALMRLAERDLLATQTLEECLPVLRSRAQSVSEAALMVAIGTVSVPRYVFQFVERIAQQAVVAAVAAREQQQQQPHALEPPMEK